MGALNRTHFLQGATGLFVESPEADPKPLIEGKNLRAKIGEFTLRHDFLSGSLGKVVLLPILESNFVTTLLGKLL